MLLGSAFFAVMGTVASWLGRSLTWPALAVARGALPLLFVLVLAHSARVKLVGLGAPRILWLRSIAGSFSMVSTFYALSRLPVSDVFTLTNMFPIWVAVISWGVLRKPPPFHVWLSVASAITGVVLMYQDESHSHVLNLAVFIAVGASVWTAVAMLGLNRLQGIDPRAIVVHFSAVSLLFAVGCLFVFIDDRPRAAAPAWYVVAVLLVVIGLCATIGQLCLTRAFIYGAAPKVSVIGLSQAVFAMLLDRVVLGRQFHLWTLAGMTLVIVPSAWVILHRDG
jgi:drug/metabolite transporter (DMT)-like permease